MRSVESLRLSMLGCLAIVAACSARGGAEPSQRAQNVRVALAAFPHAKTSIKVGKPLDARSPFRLEASEEIWIELLPQGTRAVAPIAIEGATLFENAAESTDLIFAEAEELRILKSPAASARATYSLRVSSAVAEVRVTDGKVLIFDREGRARLQSLPIAAIDARGTRRSGSVRVTHGDDGYTLETSVDVAGLEYPITVDPAWVTGAVLTYGRYGHDAVLMKSGKVLVMGGAGSFSGAAESTAEIYDPATNSFSLAAPMAVARLRPQAALLPSGKVLVTGGRTTGSTDLASSEIYDPIADTWTEGPVMANTHYAGTATALPSGKVLVAAGFYDDHAELYDPVGSTFTALPNLSIVRSEGRALLLPSGKVLLTGGSDNAGYPRSSAEVFDPATNSWTSVASMKKARAGHAMALLPSGNVLVAGAGSGGGANYAELYDPAANVWVKTTPLNVARATYGLVTLPSGHALAVGGNGYSIAKAEIFDPIAATWTEVTGPTGSRTQATYTRLPAGKVLLVGGLGTGGSDAQTFEEQALGALCIQNGDCSTNHCVDGVCCNEACTGNCKACDVAGSIGICANVASGPIHGGTRSCAPYATCTAGACATSCAVSADCVATSYCVAGKCVPRVANGLACAADEQCGSNFCVDGVCCNAKCGEQCQACDVPGSFGTCAPVNGEPRGGRPGCDGVGAGTECGTRCDGFFVFKCSYPSASLACGTSYCSASLAHRPGTCDGAGLCADIVSSCGAYGCNATVCKITCAADGDCATGHYCKAGACTVVEDLGVACTDGSTCKTGHCVEGVCCSSGSCASGSSCATATAKGSCSKLAGQPCAIGVECGTGFCVDGVCCEAACDGQCEACNVAGSAGACTAVAGAPHGARARCDDGGGDACKALGCNGSVDRKACTAFIAGAETLCGGGACTGSNFTGASTCDGKGACAPKTPTSCVPFACDDRGCLTTCTEEGECAQGFKCEAGACVARPATCTPDNLASVDKVGVATSCAPYLCAGDGTCAKSCASSAECQGGSVCDGTSCVASTPAADSGGCTMGRPSSSHASSSHAPMLLALTLLAIVISRRKSLAVALMMLSGCKVEQEKPTEIGRSESPIVAMQRVGDMNEVRVDHTITPIAGGKALVAGGGVNNYDYLTTAEIYDPVTKTFTVTAPMPGRKSSHSALRLPSGKVLLAGGFGDSDYLGWIYDPVANSWSVTPSYGPVGGWSYLHPLPAGKALLLDMYGAAYVYDPGIGDFYGITGVSQHLFGASTSLLSGKVFVCGGETSAGVASDNAWLFDPSTSAFTATAKMPQPRRGHAMIGLPSGKVLVTGGQIFGGDSNTTALYDPASNTWGTSAPMLAFRREHRLFLLSNNRVLAVGGALDVELYDPLADTWTSVGNRTSNVARGGSGLLDSGKVLMSGGFEVAVAVDSADVFELGANGGKCDISAECASTFCLDGACCNTACTGTCSACDLPGKVGTCSPVTGDPRHARTCGGFSCKAGACATSCAVDSDCTSNAYCDAGVCTLKRAAGAACTATKQCGSAFCVDGVCCNSACNRQCEACDDPKSLGTCAAVYATKPHGARPLCSGAGLGTECGAICDGKDPTKCTFAPNSQFCSADKCSDGIEAHASTCDGAGACKDVPSSCGSYTCGGDSCRTTCSADGDCTAGHYCKAGACVVIEDLGTECTSKAGCKTGNCVDGVCCATASCEGGASCSAGAVKGFCAKGPGAICAAGTECGSGVCADGVCCDRACDGQCEACDAVGSKGKCQPIGGAPHGARTACDSDGTDPCKARACDGTATATCEGYAAGPTVSCSMPSCDGGNLTAASKCDGSGNCLAPKATSCAPYACSPRADGCRAGCTVDAHCSDGFECRESKCISKGDKCSSDGVASLSKDGARTECAPFRCGSIGTCLTECVSSADCATLVCDLGSKTCVAPAASEESGGCAMTTRSSSATMPALLLGLLTLAVRRKRASIT